MQQLFIMPERVILSRRDFLKKSALAGGVLLIGTRSSDSTQEGPMTLSKAVGSDGLDLVQWEARNGPSRLMQLFWERFQPPPARRVELVQSYFASNPRPLVLERKVERIMTGHINEAFEEAGIYSKMLKTFKFIPPPKSIAISYKREIGVIGQMPLRFGITLAEIEALEDRVEKLLPGVSALVFDCNGWATFPPGVIRGLSRRHSYKTAAHEITHYLLGLTPVGLPHTLSFFGLPRNNQIATINETTANMMGQEIGQAIEDRYYREDQPIIKQMAYIEIPKAPTLDHDKVLKETAISVSWYLEQGLIDKAEMLMDKMRKELNAAGFPFRKLNQAYFAIYGIYADGPASIDPIGANLRKLREGLTMGEFFRIVSNITSSNELEKKLQKAAWHKEEVKNFPNGLQFLIYMNYNMRRGVVAQLARASHLH